MQMSMSQLFNRKRGFTLPEIVVVIAIIGILSAISYRYLTNSKAQARDRARLVAVEQVGLAIEQYKDKYGRYPARGCVEVGKNADYWAGSETYGTANWLSPTSVPCTDYIVGLVPEFLPALPREPGPVKAGRGYVYRTDGTGSFYKFMTHYSVESLLVDNISHPFSKHGGCTDVSSPSYGVNVPTVYAVYSVGAECF